MKKRLIFIDDEDLVLQSLKRVLYSMNQEWEMEFVDSGAKALALMEERPFDIVISDVRMPSMSGVQLLEEVRRRYPETTRFFLSGQSCGEAVLNCIDSPDYFFSKPADVTAIKTAVGGISQLERLVFERTAALRESEEHLRESKARFDQLAEQSGTITWEVDTDGLFTYVSHVAELVLGYRPEDLVGKRHFYDLCAEADREALKLRAFTAFEQKEPFQNLEHTMQAKDRHQVWVFTNGIPLLNVGGTLRGYRGSNTDISERKRAEEALRRSEDHSRLILNSAAGAICGVDMHGNCTFCNAAGLRLLGYARQDELLGRNMHRQIHQKYQDGSDFPIEACRSLMLAGKANASTSRMNCSGGQTALAFPWNIGPIPSLEMALWLERW